MRAPHDRGRGAPSREAEGRAAPRADAAGQRLRAAARVARADLAGRPVQTGLTALAIFAAATALVVTLALRNGLDDPFAAGAARDQGRARQRLRRGVTWRRWRNSRAWSRATCARARTCSRRSPAGPSTSASRPCPARRAAVDVPRVTDGRRPGRGEVLVERSFARESGLRVGDTLRVAP